MKYYIVLVTAFMIACATAPATGSLSLKGRILDDGGTVYDNVEVQLFLVGNPDVLQTTQSGGGGTYEFQALNAGKYLIVIDAENQMDGPLPVENPEPLSVNIAADGSIQGSSVFIMHSTLSSSERIEQKYSADFSRWKAEDANVQGSVVFAGSSTIRLWSSLVIDFPGIKVANRGFGGSTASELRLILPAVTSLNPRAVVLYEGDNDLANEGGSVEKFIENMTAITATLREKIRPNRIILLSIKPSRTRWDRWPVFQEANTALKALAAAQGYTYVDVSTPMLSTDGVQDKFMGNDGLHMSSDGYALWTSILRPVLIRVLAP